MREAGPLSEEGWKPQARPAKLPALDIVRSEVTAKFPLGAIQELMEHVGFQAQLIHEPRLPLMPIVPDKDPRVSSGRAHGTFHGSPESWWLCMAATLEESFP